MIDNVLNVLDSDNFKDSIELRKIFSSIKHDAETNIKTDFCYLCNKKTTSFCNSHTIPQFCLRSISSNGMVNNIFYFFNNKISKDKNGVKNAGTFHLICNDCDNMFFKDYETPENYLSEKFSNKILAQIATKNYLQLINKRLLEIESYKFIQTGNSFLSKEISNKQIINHIDLAEFKNLLNKSIKASKKDDNNYYIIFAKKLDYVAPIAYQGAVNLWLDFNGEVINDIYNINPKYKMQLLHICVFPMKSSTFILLYIENGSTRYRKFYKYLRKLNDIQKLNVISYIILLYSEDYFFNEDLLKSVDINEIKKIAHSTPEYFSDEKFYDIKPIKNDFNLTKWNNCPNILSKEFAIKK